MRTDILPTIYALHVACQERAIPAPKITVSRELAEAMWKEIEAPIFVGIPKSEDATPPYQPCPYPFNGVIYGIRIEEEPKMKRADFPLPEWEG